MTNSFKQMALRLKTKLDKASKKNKPAALRTLVLSTTRITKDPTVISVKATEVAMAAPIMKAPDAVTTNAAKDSALKVEDDGNVNEDQEIDLANEIIVITPSDSAINAFKDEKVHLQGMTDAHNLPSFLDVHRKIVPHAIHLTRLPSSNLGIPGVDMSLGAATITPSPPTAMRSASTETFVNPAISTFTSSTATLVDAPTYPRNFSLDDLSVVRKLGAGASGTVYHVKDTKTGADHALKIIYKGKLSTWEAQNIAAEQSALRKLAGTPGVIQLKASTHDADNFHILTDYHPAGDLDSILAQKGRLSDEEVRFIAADLLLALEKVHSHGIVHRDVKPANILVDKTGRLVLADFGLAVQFDIKEYPADTKPHWRHSHGSEAFVTSMPGGSPAYMSPEQCLKILYSYGIDHWAVGVILFELLTGRLPFGASKLKDLHKTIIYGTPVFLPEDKVPPVTQRFILAMLSKDPRERIQPENMKSDPYFKSIDWNALVARTAVSPLVVLPADICKIPRHLTSNKVYRATPYSAALPDPLPEFTFCASELQYTAVPISESLPKAGKAARTFKSMLKLKSIFGFKSCPAPITTPETTPEPFVGEVVHVSYEGSNGTVTADASASNDSDYGYDYSKYSTIPLDNNSDSTRLAAPPAPRPAPTPIFDTVNFRSSSSWIGSLSIPVRKPTSRMDAFYDALVSASNADDDMSVDEDGSGYATNNDDVFVDKGNTRNYGNAQEYGSNFNQYSYDEDSDYDNYADEKNAADASFRTPRRGTFGTMSYASSGCLSVLAQLSPARTDRINALYAILTRRDSFSSDL